MRTVLLIFAIIMSSCQAMASPDHFITRDGKKLLNGENEFRFISFNVPTLSYIEDEMAFEQTNPYGLPNEYEMRDLYSTVREMGGNVVRMYTIPVRHEHFPDESVTYVEAPGVFNEEAFKALDLAIALAAEYDIRVIIPLVNNWEWHGGRPQYAAFRGKTREEFWTDRQLIEDFKLTIDHVINRTNTITGIPYKEDKSIMAWETGNELQNPPAWGIEISRYIKSLDQNHLLIDGFHAIHLKDLSVWVQQYSIDEPSIDLINTHHYEPTSIETIRNLKKTVEMVGGKKPIFVGEFGFISTSGIEDILNYVIGEEAIPGALIWSLRRHHRDGGFYHHTEPAGLGKYRSYHWPGFDDSKSYDERNLLALMRDKAFEIRGMETPPVSIPEAPGLLPFDDVASFSWRGSMGASGYDIERSTNPDGPWEHVAYNIDDIETPGFDLFTDETVIPGKDYYYRVIARNAAGTSAPSNIVGPVSIEYLRRVDRARNLAVLHHSENISVKTGDYRTYKEAFSRLSGDEGAYIIYRSPAELKEFRLFTFESDADQNIEAFISQDAETWEHLDLERATYSSSETNYDYQVPNKYTAPATKLERPYIKLVFKDTVSVVRAEIDYR